MIIINAQISELRAALKVTQEEMGNRLGVTRAAISRIEKGDRNLTEQMILSICREFNVNEHWLRTGEGDMFAPNNTDERLAYALGKILANDDEFVKRAMLSLAELDKSQWDAIKNLITKIAGETN